ncbi:hypothetical protein ANO14919_104860 [Xylariales sp. No.14919]|nr:hypothetical protein ANO14919_104860 [Xylariales sp. No.14919]
MKEKSQPNLASSALTGHVDSVASMKHGMAEITRKIDRHILPLMLLCYLCQFLDKALINYANIMGLSTSLRLRPDEFPWLSTSLYIGYAASEFIQGYLLQKYPIAKVLGLNVVLWGVSVTATAGVQNFAGAVAVRTFLGVFEAVISPALVLMTAQWYTKKQATPRTGLWYCGLGLGQITGGFISFAAQHGPTTPPFEGWRVIFAAVGVFNILIGVLVTVFMPSDIDEAKFLSENDKSLLRHKLLRDQSGNGRKVFRFAGILEALRDVQVWLLFFAVIFLTLPSGIITTFSATLIRGFGYDAKQAALLNVPSGVVSIIATLLSTFSILYDFPRWLAICLLMVPSLVGAGLLSFYTSSQAGSLAGIYLINFTVAPLALFYALVGSNTQGYTKKVTANAMIAIAFSIANIISPQTFRAKDAPGYIPAKITVLVAVVLVVLTTVAIRVLYGVRNEKTLGAREAELRTIDGGQTLLGKEEEMMDQTDRTNPSFVYVY